MEIDAEQAVKLVEALAWPMVALVGLATLGQPAAVLLRSLGGRATKISLFNVEFELAELKEVRSGLVEALGDLSEQTISEDDMAAIAAGASDSSADYVVATLGSPGAKDAWLTSRLFLLAALLERPGSFRCIVFRNPNGAYVGAAEPSAVRIAVAGEFPEYEKVFARKLADMLDRSPSALDAAGHFSEEAVYQLFNDFFGFGELVLPDHGEPRDKKWVRIARSYGTTTWERAEWLDAKALERLIGRSLSRGTHHERRGGREENRRTLRNIAEQDGRFVAKVDRRGNFAGLYDRRDVLERVARSAVAAE
jgi:hypothetical protein